MSKYEALYKKWIKKWNAVAFKVYEFEELLLVIGITEKLLCTGAVPVSGGTTVT